MLLVASLVVVLYVAASWAQSDRPPRTRLRSSAFGIAGQNASYDYVGPFCHVLTSEKS